MVEWCWQAEKRGLLTGDLCPAQSTAKNIAILIDERNAMRRRKGMYEFLSDVFDLWVKVEHPNVWNAAHEGESEGVDRSVTADLSSDSMAGLMAQLMAEADMEADMFG